MTEQHGAEIVTFYSYKGGTGRSMQLANVAWILASNGKRVLMVDWDLEAPGLHRYVRPFLIDKELTGTEGLIDLMWSFSDAAMTPVHEAERVQGWHEAFADLAPYIAAVQWSFRPPGCLDLLPAGKQGATYSRRVNSFNWQNFYERLGGGVFLEAMKSWMRTEYDYVLIDSRTGVSDTAGICTVQMPDALVVCFTANNQSIEGCASILQSVRAQWNADGRPPESQRILPVLTRVDGAEKDKVTARRDFAREMFDPYVASIAPGAIEEYWRDIEVPYVAWYAYEEVLAAFADKYKERTSVLESAEALTRMLTGGETWSAVRPNDHERTRVLRQFAFPHETPASGTSTKGRSGRNVVLFFAGNPAEANPLMLGEECAAITRELRMTPFRDDFQFESRWATTLDEMMRHLNELQPTVIHFSGHGSRSTGVRISDDSGLSQPLPPRALALMIGSAAPSTRLIVLDACFDEGIASSLREIVECVVGTDGAMGDSAARAFSIRFYGALGNRRSVGNAVAQATAALAAKQLPEDIWSHCLTRKGIDADKLMLAVPR